MFDAIPLYKKAVHLVPDIEYRIHEWGLEAIEQERINNNQINNSTTASDDVVEQKATATDDDDELDDNVDLYARFLDSVQETGGRWCQSSITYPSTTHISHLPMEVFHIITRWIVSNELDVQALERTALTCKGFYLYARDPELWRLICLKVWGVHLGKLNPSAFNSWRQMFFERSRLRFNGCYISKTEYFRLGENSFQDQAYKPVHHVEYYRYLRFFPDGACLMLTAADEPPAGVKKLRQRQPKNKKVMRGFYRLNNDQVTIMLHRKVAVEATPVVPERRVRGGQLAPPPPPLKPLEQTFHVELQIQSSSSGRRFNQLHWLQYRILQHRGGGTETVSEFDLTKDKYPGFWFSPVAQYSEESNSILTL